MSEYKVWVKNFQGEYSSETFSSKDEAWGFIQTIDAAQSITVEHDGEEADVTTMEQFLDWFES